MPEGETDLIPLKSLSFSFVSHYCAHLQIERILISLKTQEKELHSTFFLFLVVKLVTDIILPWKMSIECVKEVRVIEQWTFPSQSF